MRQIILYGTGGEKLELHYDQPRGKGVLYQPFEGVANNLERRYQETQSDASKRELEEFMTQCPCPACQGRRLKPEALAVTVGGLSIWQATELPVDEELAFFNGLTLTETQQLIAAQILKEIRSRLGFLQSVGLQLPDPVPLQRHPVRRREPAHPAGHPDRLQPDGGAVYSGRALHRPAPAGQRQAAGHPQAACGIWAIPCIVVEHDEDTMRAADYLIDIGPGAGSPRRRRWWPPARRRRSWPIPNSLTGQYLSGKKRIEVPAARRPGNGKLLTVRGARGEQPEKHRRLHPAGDLHLRHRRLRQRQVLSGQRDHL